MNMRVIAFCLTLLCSVMSVAGLQASGQNSTGGTVVAWGWDWYGQCNVPADLAGVVQVACGVYHSLALKSDGTVVAWGFNGNGQCNVPADLAGVIQIAAGYRYSLALKSDGTVVSWGSDMLGGRYNVPVGLGGVTQVAAGWQHSLALKSDGTVVAWGYNGDGQCDVPTDLTGVVQIAAGWAHSLALKSDGTVVAWGDNYWGQLDMTSGLAGVVQVAAKWEHNLVLKSDETVIAGGWDELGQCEVPAGLTKVTQVAAGFAHSLAVKSDGSAVAWGYNDFGQADVPAGLAKVTQVAAGFGHSLALVVPYDQDPHILVDIKPGTFPNNVNPRSGGEIPVAILTTGTFDATAVDPLSVEFGPGKAKEAHGKGHLEDANGDGTTDMVLHFRTEETGIQCGATEVTLSGRTLTGESFSGADAIVTVGCGKGDVPLASGLEQNYPNPFNPTTKLGFGIADLGFVSLKVYDVLGREVATLVNEVKEPGSYTVQFDGSRLSSGVYFYRLTAGDFVQTRRLLLSK